MGRSSFSFDSKNNTLLKEGLVIDKVAFAQAIRQQLRRVPNTREAGDGVTFIQCPYHSDSTPSGKVNHDPSSPFLGHYYCFGCSASKPWRELATTLNLETLDGKEFASPKVSEVFNYYDMAFLEREDDEEDEAVSEASDKFSPGLHDLTDRLAKSIGIGEGWRGFTLDFLREIDASLLRTNGGYWYVFLPVYVYGERKGYIRAQLRADKSNKVPSYLNKKGDWSKTYGLFPFDYSIQMMRDMDISTIVLVEGPRDALRLIKYGIPAMSILGTQSWSTDKIRLLEFADVRHLVLCFDGDNAGREATKTIRPTVRHAFDVQIKRLWVTAKKLGLKKIDPGNMPVSIVKSLKNYLR